MVMIHTSNCGIMIDLGQPHQEISKSLEKDQCTLELIDID